MWLGRGVVTVPSLDGFLHALLAVQASPATGPSANAQRSGAGASASSASASLGLAPSPRPAPPTPAAVVPVALAAAPPPPAPAAAADLQPHGTDMDMALERFKAGASGFHGMIDMLVAATEKERQELEEARQQLQEDRRAFEEECRRVQNVLSDVEQVTLNVGGFKFTTSVSTLRNAPSPSLFNAMFSGRHNVVKDAEGCYFIDRDGRHFHDVLNFLRDGAFSCPSEATDFKYLLELRSEANYYGLTGLMQAIDRFPYGQIKVARTTALNMEDRSAKPCMVMVGWGWVDEASQSRGRFRGGCLLCVQLECVAPSQASCCSTRLRTCLHTWPPRPAPASARARPPWPACPCSWMYEDGQDEIVFSVDKPVQLLGVGLCGTEGGLTAELELYEVDAEVGAGAGAAGIWDHAHGKGGRCWVGGKGAG